jgi:hypothetical protein
VSRRLLILLIVLASCQGTETHVVLPGSLDTSANAAPVADPGVGATALVGTTIILDGSNSVDPDGVLTAYQWTLTNAPVGSGTSVGAMAVESFTLDQPGTFTFTLTVTDDDGASAVGSVTFVANALSISVDAGPDQSIVWSDAVQLTGTIASEVSISPKWTVVAQPAGSQPTLVNASSLTPTLTYDREGTYTLRLTADSGFGIAFDELTVTVSVARQMLDYVLVDAAYSAALDRYVIVSDLPPTLHLLNPIAGTEQTLALPESPVVVTLSPDGLRAAVGYQSKVAIVDLQTKTITATYTVPRPVYTLVFDGARVHVFHKLAYTWGQIVTINLSNGNLVMSADEVYTNMEARLQPVGGAVYVSGYSRYTRYELSAGTLAWVREVDPFKPDYGLSGPVWFVSNGTAMITQGGSVFRASTDAALDMTYIGTFGGGSFSTGTYTSFAHSAALSKFAALKVEYNGFTPVRHVLQIHDAQYWLTRACALPDTPVAGTPVKSEGRFVAFNAASSKVFVIARAGSTVGAPHALYTFDP